VLGQILRGAFDGALRRMFQPVPADASPELDVTVSSLAADVVEVAGGREVILEARVVLAATATGEIDRLTYSERSPVLGPDRDSIVNAIDRASQQIAGSFERTFADSKPMFTWIRARGIEPVDSALSWPLRADRIAFIDVGGGPIIGGGDAAAPGLLARLGVAGRWFVVQGIAGRWAPSFDMALAAEGGGTQYSADLVTTDLGIEGGLRFRVQNAMELRAGAGVHALWGTAEAHTTSQFHPTSSFSKVAPTVFGSFQYTLWPTGSRFRVRLGIELRKYVSTTVGFPEFSRTIPIADTYLGGYVGLEMPTGSPPARSGGAGK
jgi:hypothetical protein